ncbi:MAG: sigma-70 family RNA polymerase sigma factor [Planctomycetota bacterium]
MDQDSLQELIARHSRLIRHVACAWCRDATDREDVVQEVLVQLWRSAERYDPRFAETTWVYRIALNVAISFHRRESRHRVRRTTLDDAADRMPEPAASEEGERVERLRAALDRLPAIEKALVLLHLDGNDHSTIADVMGISVSNVGTRLARIRNKLRDRLSGRGGDPKGTEHGSR